MGEHIQIRPGRHVFHQDFAGALALERHPAGEHLIENDADGVEIDLLAVTAVGHFRGHVVDGADALGLAAATTRRDELRQAVVADLDGAVLDEDVAGLQVAMDDAALMEVADSGADAVQPVERFLRRHAFWMAGDCLVEAFASHMLHHDPGVAVVRLLDVVKGDEMGMLEVKALADAAQLDMEVSLNQLERDFLAAVGEGMIDLAEAAPADAVLQRIAGQRPIARCMGESHRSLARASDATGSMIDGHGRTPVMMATRRGNSNRL